MTDREFDELLSIVDEGRANLRNLDAQDRRSSPERRPVYDRLRQRGISVNDNPTDKELGEAALSKGYATVGGYKVRLGQGQRRNMQAIREIEEGKVSFDPNATQGLSKEVTEGYGTARAKAISDALSNIGRNDPDFITNFGEGKWFGMTTMQKLAAYRDHIQKQADAMGSIDIPSYASEKQKFLENRQFSEAGRRARLRGIADGTMSEPGKDTGTTGVKTQNQNKSQSTVGVDDLVYGSNRPGYTGVNGDPFNAGDPNKRSVMEYSRSQGRAAAERAMENDARHRQNLQNAQDTHDFLEYRSRNYYTYQRRRDQALRQQRWQRQLDQLANKFDDMAYYANQQAIAGNFI